VALAERMTIPSRDGHVIESAAFSPDGKSLVATSWSVAIHESRVTIIQH
jgi:hypothetical protein